MPDMLRPSANPTSVTPETDERLIWASLVDNRYEAEVQHPEGASPFSALLLVFDTHDGDKVIHAEVVDNPRPVTPDNKTRGAWQVMSMAAVDAYVKSTEA